MAKSRGTSATKRARRESAGNMRSRVHVFATNLLQIAEQLVNFLELRTENDLIPAGWDVIAR